MKQTLFFFLMLSVFSSTYGQELRTIKDSINHYEIGVPIGWRSTILTGKSVSLVAIREKVNEQDVVRENFNIIILNKDEKDLEISFIQFKESLSKAEGFKVIEQGVEIIDNRKYMYLIETHKNKISKEDMHNYVFFTNNNGKILILTMVATSSNFERFKVLYSTIGRSLKY